MPFAVEHTGGWAKANEDIVQIFADFAKTRGKTFSSLWFKINTAFAHRRATLKGVHLARDEVLGYPGYSNDVSMEDMEGEAAATFHVNPILAF